MNLKRIADHGRLEIPTVEECRHVLIGCFDQELLLAWKLGFHYFISAAEARRLKAEHVCRDEPGLPVAFRLPARGRDERQGWYVPIKEQDRPLMQILLPEKGRLFQSTYPYDRLFRLVESRGIGLGCSSIGRTCLIYATASGLYHEAVLELAGLKPERLLRWMHSPISREDANEYWLLTVPPDQAAALPKRLPPIGRVNCYE